jgi:DNA invertase Pin-like site-specific DNA recombinase
MLDLHIQLSDEARQKLSDERKGAGNPAFGTNISNEHRQAIIDHLQGNNYGCKLTQPQADEIRYLESNKLFTRDELAIQYNVSVGTIRNIAQNKTYVNKDASIKATHNQEVIDLVIKMSSENVSNHKIAKALGMSRNGVRAILSQGHK